MLTWAIALRVLGTMLVAHGESRVALPLLQHARDMALRDVGPKDARLAGYDDALAAGFRACGKLREALRYHREAVPLGGGASLVERARTEIEGGDLQHAFADLAEAKAAGTNVDAAAADAEAFARWVPAWVTVSPRAAASPEPSGGERPAEGDDPAAVAARGEVLLARGDRDGAARVLRAAVPDLGDEPTRSALRIYVALARATQDPQAARAAVSAYQAMPEARRDAYDEMWDRARSAR